MKTLLVIAACAALSGCVQVRGTGEQWMSNEEIEKKDDTTCSSFGAPKGTQAYIDCRLRLRSDRSAEDRLRRYL